MTRAYDLLAFAAKLALDQVIGQPRTDEAFRLFSAWWGAKDTPRQQVMTEAKELAQDPHALESALADAAGDLGPTQQQRDEAEFALSVGLAAISPELPADPERAAQTIRDEVLPGRRRTFVIWLQSEDILGDENGRYVHFNWAETGGWTIRDFLEGKEIGSADLRMTALQIWQAGKHPILSVKRYALGFATEGKDNVDRWQGALRALTCTARMWGGLPPYPAR